MHEHVVLAILGSQKFQDYELMAAKIDKYLVRANISPELIISADRDGTCAMAKQYALSKGIRFQTYAIDWEAYGKSAHYACDVEIVGHATHLVVFSDGKDKVVSTSLNNALSLRKNVLQIPLIH
jgi:hypothetical protein